MPELRWISALYLFGPLFALKVSMCGPMPGQPLRDATLHRFVPPIATPLRGGEVKNAIE